jgi:transcriptional repressor NrdR|tara:strand:+ start:1453 stop:1824 length:372 start_codon:yes stop_codon:yes gene_type:complete
MNDCTVRRRRECPSCNKRFTTYEKAEINRTVIKKNQSRESYNENKMRSSIERAFQKDQHEVVSQITDKVSRKVFNKKSDTISTKEIGRYVLTELKRVDKWAYLRYASVHKEDDPKIIEMQAII